MRYPGQQVLFLFFVFCFFFFFQADSLEENDCTEVSGTGENSSPSQSLGSQAVMMGWWWAFLWPCSGVGDGAGEDGWSTVMLCMCLSPMTPTRKLFLMVFTAGWEGRSASVSKLSGQHLAWVSASPASIQKHPPEQPVTDCKVSGSRWNCASVASGALLLPHVHCTSCMKPWAVPQ